MDSFHDCSAEQWRPVQEVDEYGKMTHGDLFIVFALGEPGNGPAVGVRAIGIAKYGVPGRCNRWKNV